MIKQSRKNGLMISVSVLCVWVIVAFLISIPVWWLTGPSSVRYAKKLTTAIRESDYQTFEQIITEHPEAINTQPTNTPLLIRRMFDVPSVPYPLQTACRVGNYEMVEALLIAGAYVNIQDDLLHDTPLIYCFSYAKEGKYTIAELLLNQGADPTLHRTNNGTYDAIEECCASMMCDTEEQKATGTGVCVLNRMLDMVDADTYDPLPLVRASIYNGGNAEALKCILERFDISRDTLRDQKVGGQYVYDYAVEQGYTEIAELLK